MKGAEKGLDNADEEEFAMPTSLSGAAGAIKMDKNDHENRTEQQKKKKKRCRDRCSVL